MSGTLYHLSGTVTGSTVSDLTTNTFYWIKKAFGTHLGFSQISSYYGVNGTGLGPSDSSDGGASGDCRWVVFRKIFGTDIFDVWLGANSIGSGNSTTTDPSGSYYISSLGTGLGIATAWHSAGEAWNGTTANNGKDSFTVPWKQGSLVLPRDNGRWGIYSASLNNLMGLKQANSSLQNSGTLNFVGDDDNFVIFGDGGVTFSEPQNGVFDFFAAMLKYIPASASFELPYTMIGVSHPNAPGGVNVPFYRGITFDNNGSDGGIWISKPTKNFNSNSFGYGMDWDAIGTRDFMPSFASNPSTGTGSVAIEHPILLLSTNPYIYLGYVDFIRTLSAGFKSFDILGSGSRAVIGWGSNVGYETNFTSCSIPWSSSFGRLSDVSGTFYVSGTAFLTSSLHGFTDVTQSFLFDRVILSASIVSVYRALSGSQYVYGYDTVPSGTNPVLIAKLKQPN